MVQFESSVVFCSGLQDYRTFLRIVERVLKSCSPLLNLSIGMGLKANSCVENLEDSGKKLIFAH